MDFFQTLQTLLLASTPHEKIKGFNAFYTYYCNSNETVRHSHKQPIRFTAPSYASYCHMVPPQQVPRRKNLQSTEGQIALVHAVAHIEYSAIDLALDAAYRFQNLPQRFYDDWLEVADEEIRHFQMLETILHDLGSYYGDLSVHNALFEAQERTAHSLLHRMAVVPRYLEANGLDATPQIIEKLQRLPRHDRLTQIIEALRVIVDEEIDHVRKGDYWFGYACTLEEVSKACYFDIVKLYYPNTFQKPRHINVNGRKASGFTCNELKQLTHRHICD